jgi:hypothetical protein
LTAACGFSRRMATIPSSIQMHEYWITSPASLDTKSPFAQILIRTGLCNSRPRLSDLSHPAQKSWFFFSKRLKVCR